MVLAITNQKGGVGKTTTVLNIGVYLAIKGKRTLLIDLDPQANLSSGMDLSERTDKTKTIYNFLVDSEDILNVIKKTRIEGLDILPSSIELAGAEVELVSSLSRESILKRGIAKVADDYDFILIDCPPSLGLLTVNGLVAADQVVIPVQSEYYALEGLGQLINTIKLIKTNLNGNMDVGGVVLTMYDSRTNLSKDVAGEIDEFFKEKVFKSIIPRSIRLSEAPSRNMSIYEYAPDSAGALAYDQLADEIIERFAKSFKMIRPKLTK